MCELFAMSSRVPADVNFSLAEFSKHGGMTGPHKDGWGIAYYLDGDVNSVRQADSAANSDWVQFIRQHHFQATTIISHIRYATQGDLVLKNTQPFHREMGGKIHTFVHNGDLGDLEKRYPTGPAHRYQPVGDTDSERAFCVLMHRLEPVWLDVHRVGIPALEKRYDVLEAFADEFRSYGSLNFIYSDGVTLFIHSHKRRLPDDPVFRFPGMHILTRGCEVPGKDVSTPGLEISQWQNVVLAASTPLTDELWFPLEEGELLAVEGGEILFCRHRL